MPLPPRCHPPLRPAPGLWAGFPRPRAEARHQALGAPLLCWGHGPPPAHLPHTEAPGPGRETRSRQGHEELHGEEGRPGTGWLSLNPRFSILGACESHFQRGSHHCSPEAPDVASG